MLVLTLSTGFAANVPQMSGWMDEGFAFELPLIKSSKPALQITQDLTPTPVPNDLFDFGPMYQVVVVVVSLTKFMVTGTTKEPVGRELVCASGFCSCRRFSNRCYTAAHNLGVVTPINGDSYFVTEPEAAVVMHYLALRTFDDEVVRTLDGNGETPVQRWPSSDWVWIPTGRDARTSGLASLKLLGFRTLAAGPDEQAAALRTSHVQFTLDTGLQIPKVGLDIAVLNLDLKSF
jgi:hypothetical protein